MWVGAGICLLHTQTPEEASPWGVRENDQQLPGKPRTQVTSEVALTPLLKAMSPGSRSLETPRPHSRG